MAFVKERVSESDIQLLNSFEMYDYDCQKIRTFGMLTNWVADKEQKIYFTRASISSSYDHYDQFDLVWQGKKIAIFMEIGVSKAPTPDNPRHFRCLYRVKRILAPKEFESQQDEMFELIKEVITTYHYTNIISGIAYKTNNEIILPEFPVPKYVDEVK